MKKAVIILIALLLLTLLFSCKANRNEKKNENEKGKTVTFINELKDADVWILPETEENLKTSSWGAALISEAKTNESRTFSLMNPGDNGLYIFRMIDKESILYSVDGVILKEGFTLRIKGDDIYSITLEVADENGELTETYKVFAASL